MNQGLVVRWTAYQNIPVFKRAWLNRLYIPHLAVDGILQLRGLEAKS